MIANSKSRANQLHKNRGGRTNLEGIDSNHGHLQNCNKRQKDKVTEQLDQNRREYVLYNLPIKSENTYFSLEELNNFEREQNEFYTTQRLTNRLERNINKAKEEKIETAIYIKELLKYIQLLISVVKTS